MRLPTDKQESPMHWFMARLKNQQGKIEKYVFVQITVWIAEIGTMNIYIGRDYKILPALTKQ
jgi:hypothetical protein